MNLTALATPLHDKNDALNLGVPRPKGGWQLTGPTPVPRQKPTISLLRAACDSFHVKGTARLLAYELLSYWSPNGTVFPSVATLADGLGLQRRVVHRHLVHLERVGLWVRKARPGRASIYELRLPGPTHSSAYPPTHASAPISNQREVTKKNVQRTRCAACGYSWPSEFGPTCYKCMKDPPQPSLAPERPTKTALTEATEDQLRTQGWLKGKEGTWTLGNTCKR